MGMITDQPNHRPAQCCALCRHSKWAEGTMKDIMDNKLMCTQACAQTAESCVCDEFE